MKCFILFTLFLFIIGCSKKEAEIDIKSWYVSNTDEEEFHLSDSLQKYSQLNQQFEISKSIYWSYLAELYFLSNDTLQAMKALEKAYKLDSDSFCNNYVSPIYRYLTQRNPQRKTSIPGVLQNNLETFISLAMKCKTYKTDSRIEAISENELRNYLGLKWVSLFDQWHRVPDREMDPNLQSQFDRRNEAYLSENFFDLDLSEIPIARQIVFVVILHSHDCEWVLKWIQKYYDEFKDSKQMKDHLEHFLYRRSGCRNEEKIKEVVEKMLENYL